VEILMNQLEHVEESQKKAGGNGNAHHG
jgi:hypothetical protein